MRPQSAKNKGRTFQQYVRDLLLTTFPELEPDDVRSTSMGVPGEDIQLSPAARRKFPYQVECKSKRDSSVHTMFKQAMSHGDREPVLFVKKDRDIVLAVVTIEHFLELIKNKNENQSGN